MDLWSRLTHRSGPSEVAPPSEMARDPDLDALHQEQHDIINKTGYAAARVRDSWNERLREAWRPIHDT